jgi:hypothetical protein
VTLCRPLSYGPHTTPLKEDGRTLEKGTNACFKPSRDNAVTSDQRGASPPSPSALCGHPRCCTAIPSTASPSLVLWEPRTTRHHRAHRCATSSLPSTQPSSWRTPNGQKGGSHPATIEAALLTVKFRQPSHEFTFGVGMTFVPYPLVLTPVV